MEISVNRTVEMEHSNQFNTYLDWQRVAAGQQQTFFHQFGDRQWDLIAVDDRLNTLEKKLSMILFVTPYHDCSFKQKEVIETTRSKILELSGSGDIHFGCVFISTLSKKSPRTAGIFPLIRTKPTYGDDEFFVEAQPGRVYKDWTDFLENNKLEKCDMCFPIRGFYSAIFSDQVRIEFRESPSCDMLFKVLDVVNTVGKFASAGVLAVGTFFPITTPFAIAAGVALGTTTAYSTTRTIVQLIDRGSHHQSIGLGRSEAAELWIGMAADIIGSILIGGSSVIPRLVASGELILTSTRVLDVLRWASIGFNSFGVLANITLLIIQFRNGTLNLYDLNFFIMSCLFIGNLVLSPYQAERIVQTLSTHSPQIGNLFKMSVNTAFSAIKSIVSVNSLTLAFEVICGSAMVSLLRHCNMKSTAFVIQFAGNALRSFRRGTVNVPTLCLDLYRILNDHLNQVVAEVLDVWKFLRSMYLQIQGQYLFERPQLHDIEMRANVEAVLDSVYTESSLPRSVDRETLIKLATQLARNTNVQNEREFVTTCQILMNDVASKCEQRLVLETSAKSYLSAQDRIQILRDVMHDFREKFEGGESAQPAINDVDQRTDSLFLLPLYRSEEYEMFVFETDARVPNFDQFVFNATCRLFNVENFFDRCELLFNNERVIVINYLSRSIIFAYTPPLENSENALGIIILRV